MLKLAATLLFINNRELCCPIHIVARTNADRVRRRIPEAFAPTGAGLFVMPAVAATDISGIDFVLLSHTVNLLALVPLHTPGT